MALRFALRAFAFLPCVLFGASFSWSLPPQAEACLACHDGETAPRARVESFDTSVHRRLECIACHADAADAPHPARPASVDCGRCHADPKASYRLSVHAAARAQGNARAASCPDCHGRHDVRPVLSAGSRVFSAALPRTCGRCHPREAAEFASSVHGMALSKGVREAPVCTDCHGEHTIRRPSEEASSAFHGAITRTCSGCHGIERIARKFGLPSDRVQSFLDSYHGLAGNSGDLKAANCASCHGWHDVLASSDPRARTHPRNLPATCGQCHEGAAARLASGGVHVALSGSGKGSRAASLLRLFYLWIIPWTLGVMAFHNLADLVRKAAAGLSRRPAHEHEPLNRGERLQHAALMLSFGALAYSGFALKFPMAWWAAPFHWGGGEALRLAFHRGAALVFVALALWHAVYLLGSRKGRAHLRLLLPARRDFLDPMRLLAYNLGLRRDKPALPEPGYVQKAEYWALVWGSAIMIATGAVLVFHNTTLARFPFWVLECARVAHFWEAVLACAAIVVWHFYWVLFDPDVYPMDASWLFGKTPKEKEHGG